MTVVRIQDFLQRKANAALTKLAAARVVYHDIYHPAAVEYRLEMKRLGRLGLDIPMPGKYSVAAFAAPSISRLQEAGRRIYYSKLHRFHALLPWLGELMPSRPRVPAPGIMPPRRNR